MNPILKEQIERHEAELAKSELRKRLCDGVIEIARRGIPQWK